MAEFAASLLGIISVGTKVTLVLFQVASDLGSAGEDVRWLGTEISVFCVVLNDLNTTLERAKQSGFSLDSLKSMGAIVDHCKEILERIQKVVDKLAGEVRRDEKSKVTYVARAKWIFAKGKVDCLRTKLESSKLTLSVMMTGFNWALMLDRKQESENSSAEAARQNELFQSLLMSQQFVVQKLERLESDAGENSSSRGQEDILIPTSNISQTLNSAVFEDGMAATERQWTSGQASAIRGSQTLEHYANRLSKSARSSSAMLLDINSELAVMKLMVQEDPDGRPINWINLFFYPASIGYGDSRFNDEPQSVVLTFVELKPHQTLADIKKAILNIAKSPYAESNYDLHLHQGLRRGRRGPDERSSRRDHHLETWSEQICSEIRVLQKSGSDPWLSVQNTLGRDCRDDKPVQADRGMRREVDTKPDNECSVQ